MLRDVANRLGHTLLHPSLWDARKLSNLYAHSAIPVLLGTPPELNAQTVISSLFPDVSGEVVNNLRSEFLQDSLLSDELNRRFVEKRQRRVIWRKSDELLYLAARLTQPSIVVETGVFDGKSSAVWLAALAKNDKGLLVSIDLPATNSILGSTDKMKEPDLPAGCDPGWCIPDRLRSRHRLLLGDSKLLLPQVLDEYDVIDIFIHDSLHTFEHQYFEYGQAWPHLRSGGMLLSDDILWSSAFHLFAKQVGKRYCRSDGCGALVK